MSCRISSAACAGDFFVLDGAVADVNEALLGEMRDEAGIGAVFEHRRRAGLGPFAGHAADVHVPPVERHLLRRRALGVFVGVPQLDRRVDVEHAAVVAPLEDFAAVNVPGQVNQQVAGLQIFAEQRAHVLARHALARELHAALQPRRQHAAAVFEIHDGDVGARRLEMFDEDGEGALRHGPVTDEQDFVFEFQHGKIVLARHFVQKNFALQEFIEIKDTDGRIQGACCPNRFGRRWSAAVSAAARLTT